MTNRVRTPIAEAFRKAFRERDKGRVETTAKRGAEPTTLGRASLGSASISEADLLRVVTLDLGLLLNTVNFAAGTNLSDHDEVRGSIVNFGFPDMVHRSTDEITVNDIGAELEWALSTFEPRLVPSSIKIGRDRRVDADSLRIRFIVSADLDCEPLKRPVQFLADLERDTGRIAIQRR